MTDFFSKDRLRRISNRVQERLWVKPLTVCLLSIAAAFIARFADGTGLSQFVPEIAPKSVETLLSIMAASMLVIATFSVASMVSAYASASRTATPRAFTLMVADDASQNALSTFIGAFIFSIVALTAVNNDFFQHAGLFVLFSLTAFVFAIVIVTFVRWVDRIARLGRVGSTIDKVEEATAAAFKRQRNAPTLHARPMGQPPHGTAVFPTCVGYLQHVNMVGLQAWASESQVRVVVAVLPGAFVTPDRPLVYLRSPSASTGPIDSRTISGFFQIGDDRLFGDDPRFGLVVLSEIAGRALSPAVNDPGTAIDIVGTLVRLFVLWNDSGKPTDEDTPKYDCVEVPAISVRDMFDDAFTAIARDGASLVEVAIRLQKALRTLEAIGDIPMRDAARYHASVALARAESALNMPGDIAAVRDAVATQRSTFNAQRSTLNV